MHPEVSVIVPVYNNAKYLEDCLSSALEQTLENIEIICINGGSTDSSLDIMESVAARDKRVRVIDGPNMGYGGTMNAGLAEARGTYVAFLEPDGVIARDAYRKLVEEANESQADIAEGNYFLMEGVGSERILESVELTKAKERYGVVFRPLETPWSFYLPVMNSSGLFRRKMLEKYNIRHNEVLGDAHQDMGFWFQALCCAQSMLLIDESFYKHRRDNTNASTKSDSTVFYTLTEYQFISTFLDQHEQFKQEALPFFYHRKYDSVMFSYSRAELSLKLPFIRQFAAEFKRDLGNGTFTFDRFTEQERAELQSIIDDPDSYYVRSLASVDSNAVDLMKKEISNVRLQIKNMKVNQGLRQSVFKDKRKEDANRPNISIIVPAYNSSQYIRECLDSIFSQNLRDVEVICIDDGSSDDTLAILKEYESKHRSMLVLHQENQGQGAARNYGLKMARGRYVQFVDSDDMLAEGALESLFNLAECDALDVLFYDGETFYDNKKLRNQFRSFKTAYQRQSAHRECSRGVDLFRQLQSENAYRVSPCMALFRLDFLYDFGISFPEGMIYEDNAFTLKVICLAERAKHIDLSGYRRRIREGSTMTTEVSAKNVHALFLVYLEMLQFVCQQSWDYATDKAIAQELKGILSQIRQMYDKLNNSQKLILGSLPPSEQAFFDGLVFRTEEQEIMAKKLEVIKKSPSWRIGRAFTLPARAVKRVLRK